MSFNYRFDTDFFDKNLFSDEFFQVLAISLLVVAVISLAAAAASYVLNSLAVYRIAKRRGLASPWIAWIPVAKRWTLGAIADEFDRRTVGYDRRFRIFNLVVSVLDIFTAFIMIAAFGAVIETITSIATGDMDEIFEALMVVYGSFSGMSSYCIYIAILIVCLNGIIMFKIYDSLAPKLALIFTLLSVVVPLFGPISLLCMKDKELPKEEMLEELPEAVKIGWYDQD